MRAPLADGVSPTHPMPEPPTPAPSTSIAAREVDAILEQGLRLVRDRSAAVLNAVDDGIYVLDRQGHTIFANEAAVRMLGYTLREMLGRPQHGLIHHTRVDGSAYPVEECPIYQCVTDGVYERVGGDVFWRKDGRPLRVDYTSVPIKEGRIVHGAVVTFRDTTDQHAAREQAAELAQGRQGIEERDRALAEAATTRELLEQVLEHMPAAVTVTRGAMHRIVIANALARELAGRRPLIGRTVAEAFPELLDQKAVALLDRVFASGERVAERDVLVRWDRDGDGTLHEARFDMSYLPMRDGRGQVSGVLTHSRPVAGEQGGATGSR